MKQELDKLLCEKYPKMMVNRNSPMTETCMCWGFECGDGWFNILDQLMGNIQHHIDWKEKQHNWAVKYNEMAQAGKSGNAELFADLVAKEYADKPTISAEYIRERCEEMIKNPLRDVPELIPQVTLDQVKEKFGTLRFYYTGGDDYIRGLVSMAESMSGITCEGCGAQAKTNWPKAENGGIGGWVRTICEPCEEKRELARKLADEEWEMKKLLKEGNEQ
jgi:hypothetical protein